MVEEKKIGLERYHTIGNNLLGMLRVSKEKQFDTSCVRDKESGALICVAKKFIKDNLVDEIRYYEVGGSPIFTKGNPSDILRLKKEVGLI